MAVVTVAAAAVVIVAAVTGTISAVGIMAAATFTPDRHTDFMPDPPTARSPRIA